MIIQITYFFLDVFGKLEVFKEFVISFETFDLGTERSTVLMEGL